MQATAGTRRVVRATPSWSERTFMTRRGPRGSRPRSCLPRGLAGDRPAAAVPDHRRCPPEVVEAMWEQLPDGSLVGSVLASACQARDRLPPRARRRLDRRPGDGGVAAHRGDVPRLRGRGAHVPLPDLGAPGRDVVRVRPLGPVLVVFIAALPYVILNIVGGRPRCLEGAPRHGALRTSVPRDREMRHLSLPSLSPFFFASLRYGLANGWKGLVLAEVFAATSGRRLGTSADMRDYGNFEGVVGFALYFALFSILVERLVFRRLATRVFRWRPTIAREASETPEVTLRDPRATEEA